LKTKCEPFGVLQLPLWVLDTKYRIKLFNATSVLGISMATDNLIAEVWLSVKMRDKIVSIIPNPNTVFV
jgi:hypothetical protein